MICCHGSIFRVKTDPIGFCSSRSKHPSPLSPLNKLAPYPPHSQKMPIQALIVTFCKGCSESEIFWATKYGGEWGRTKFMGVNGG